MKNKKIRMVLALLAACPLLLVACQSAGNDSASDTRDSSAGKGQVYIFNYGDYIDPDVLKQFEEETGIEVVYDTYDTNEEMYPIIESGSVRYDVVCPSDYMVERMIQNELLEEIDYDKVPNAEYISDTCREFADSFDPGNRYSIPYNWGTVGILYNSRMLPEGTITGWKDLWKSEYSDEIMMQDSLRDIYMVALKILGYSANTESESEIAEATQLLIEQKPLVYKYATDAIRDFMINESAMLGVIYSGEVLYCQEENEDLQYVVPEEGTNVWFDNWVIPKNCQNKENAEAFIDFMCRPEIGLKTFEYLHYSTPNDGTLAMMSEADKADPSVNPDEKILERCEVYHDLGDDVNRMYNRYWKAFKSE